MGPRKNKKNQAAAPAPAAPVTTEPTRSTGAERTEEGPSISGIASTPVPAAESPARTAATVDKEKIVVTLDARGGLDIDAMRPKTKEKLVEALKRSAGGLFPTAPPVPMKRWPEAAIRGGYGMLGVAEVAIAAKKYPPELAGVFTYTDEDLKILMEPTQAVLARYAGTVKHEELIALGMVLAQIHIGKVYAINQAMASYEKRRAAEAAAPAPAAEPDNRPDLEGTGVVPKVQ